MLIRFATLSDAAFERRYRKPNLLSNFAQGCENEAASTRLLLKEQIGSTERRPMPTPYLRRP